MPESVGRKADEKGADLALEELPRPDALLLAKFDYQELRETLEAIVSSMTAAASELRKETDGSPPEASTGS